MSALAAEIFGAIVSTRNRGYDHGWFGVARLKSPVVSIGNLAVGGRAKTPAILAIGRELQQRGISIDVLMRGYRRRERKLAVAETGEEPVERVGDEALLIARRLRAPVLVHADRLRAGLEGEHRFHSALHLLDDGFQHRQLARDCDVVLIQPGDLADKLLPAGKLRERPQALARASAVIVLSQSDGREFDSMTRLRKIGDFEIFQGSKQPANNTTDLNGRYFAFCAIAEPASFRRTLAELNIPICGFKSFRDHHWYSPSDLDRLKIAAKRAGADGFVTTEKDSVRLGEPSGLERLMVVRVKVQIERLDDLVALILRRCGLTQRAANVQR